MKAYRLRENKERIEENACIYFLNTTGINRIALNSSDAADYYGSIGMQNVDIFRCYVPQFWVRQLKNLEDHKQELLRESEFQQFLQMNNYEIKSERERLETSQVVCG